MRRTTVLRKLVLKRRLSSLPSRFGRLNVLLNCIKWIFPQALLEVVQSGGKNLEICVMREGENMRMMDLPEIEKVVAEVEKEKEDEAALKKKEKQSEKK